MLARMPLTTALTILSMPEVEYQAVGIGPRDLELPFDELSGLFQVFPMQLVCSDLVPADAEKPWSGVRYFERQCGEATVRVASLALSKPATGAGAELQLVEPAAAWSEAMRDVAPETYRVMMVHGTPDQVRAQAALKPSPDLVVGISELVAEP